MLKRRLNSRPPPPPPVCFWPLAHRRLLKQQFVLLRRGYQHVVVFSLTNHTCHALAARLVALDPAPPPIHPWEPSTNKTAPEDPLQNSVMPRLCYPTPFSSLALQSC